MGCGRSGLSLGRGGEGLDRALCLSIARNRPAAVTLGVAIPALVYASVGFYMWSMAGREV
jgi:hypothetical protein